MILRDLLAVLHRTSATRRQRRAAARVGQGARWRRAAARESAEEVWWRNGRMIKAGMENNPMPRERAMLRRGTEDGRDEVRWLIAIRRCLRLSPMDEKKKAPAARAAPGRWFGLLWCEVLVIAQVHHILEHGRARRQIGRVQEQGVKGVTTRGRTVDCGAAFERPGVVFRVVHADQ
jgi:hypothetical protein